MKTIAGSVVALPFSHRQDEAFLVILNLRVLLKQLVGVRGASAGRTQILKSTARIANCLADISLGVTPQRAERLYQTALFACGRTDVALKLLRADGLLTDELELEATRSVEQLAALVVARRNELLRSFATDGEPEAEMPSAAVDQDRSAVPGEAPDRGSEAARSQALGDPPDAPYDQPEAAMQ